MACSSRLPQQGQEWMGGVRAEYSLPSKDVLLEEKWWHHGGPVHSDKWQNLSVAWPTANGVVACARLPEGYYMQKMHHVDEKLKTNIQYKTWGILKPHLVLKIICFTIYVDSLQMDLGAQPEMFLLLLQEACRHDKCMILDDFQNLWG